MTRYHQIETLLKMPELDARERMSLSRALSSKLSDEEKDLLDRAIALLISESAIIGHLSAAGRQQP